MNNTSNKNTDLFDWWSPVMTGTELDLITEAINNNYINEGPKTQELQQQIADTLSVKHALLVTSGTTAIYLALRALGIGYGDEVLVPDITFIATANAVSATGARPVLCEVNIPDSSFDINFALRHVNDKTKAIIPVHVSGRNLISKQLVDFAKQNNLFIVEDAAEALHSGKPKEFLGTLGDVGCFSLSPNKLITTGQGGILVTNNSEIYDAARRYKNQGRDHIGSGFREIHLTTGENMRFTDLQAAVGLAQWPSLKDRASKQRKMGKIYQSVLSGSKNLKLCSFDIDNQQTPLWFDVLVDDRESFSDWMLKHKFQVRPYWYPISTQKPYHDQTGRTPKAKYISEHAVWLPSSMILTDEQINLAAQLTLEYVKNNPLTPYE